MLRDPDLKHSHSESFHYCPDVLRWTAHLDHPFELALAVGYGKDRVLVLRFAGLGQLDEEALVEAALDGL